MDTLWYFVGVDVAKVNGVKVLHRANTQRNGVADSLVERRVRATSEQIRQMAVLHEVGDVSHLVVHDREVFRVHLGTHLDSTVRV